MRLRLALGLVAACAFFASDAGAAAGVLFPKGDARVDRHTITVALSTAGTVTWDAIDVGGTVNEIGVVVAVKAGGRVELTEPAWVAAAELATRVVVRTLPGGATCTPVTVGGGVDFDAGLSSGGRGNGNIDVGSSSGCGGGGGSGSSSSEGSGGGGCGCSDDGKSSSKGEATGGCLTSSQGGCGSCDDNGCEPSDNGHPGCSAIHGCAPKGDDDDFVSPPKDGGASTPTVGPYEMTRIKAGDGTATAWIARNGFDAPAGFLDGLKALEADGYEVQAFRAISPATPSIVRSLRVVTTSPSTTLPLRLVRMSTGADAAATPVTLIALASGAQQIVGQSMVAIDENKLAFSGGSSNYEALVRVALGAPSDADGGARDAGNDAGAPIASRWIAESSRVLVSKTSGADGGADGGGGEVTLGDLFRQECGAREAQSHVVCAASDVPADAGRSDAGAADAGDGGDAGDDDDAGTSSDGGSSSDAGADDCKSVPRQRCDDLTLALPTGSGTASRFRGLVGGSAALVADLALAASNAPLRDARYTVRATGEAGLCVAVDDDGFTVSGSGTGTASGTGSCKTVRGRYRIDLGPLATFLVVVRTLAWIMKRRKKRVSPPRT